VVAGWVTGDEVYGANPTLRAELEARQVGYVLAVACNHPLVAGGRSARADELAARVPARAWQTISAGRGAKGHRLNDWAFVGLDHGSGHGHGDGGGADGADSGQRWLLLRRNRTTGELAFYRCWTPGRCPWPPWSGPPGSGGGSRRPSSLARACAAWTASTPPLDLLVSRMTLATVALAFLVAAATLDRGRHPTPAGLIPLTCNELQHLFAALVIRPAADLGHRLHWSVWRRRHQHRARTCHYQRQATQQP
jgi:hypothetical protein